MTTATNLIHLLHIDYLPSSTSALSKVVFFGALDGVIDTGHHGASTEAMLIDTGHHGASTEAMLIDTGRHVVSTSGHHGASTEARLIDTGRHVVSTSGHHGASTEARLIDTERHVVSTTGHHVVSTEAREQIVHEEPYRLFLIFLCCSLEGGECRNDELD